MTDSEIHLKSVDYLLNIPCWIWIDLKDVDEEIYQKVFDLVDRGALLPEYRLTWMEGSDVYFMKSIPGELNTGKPYESRCCSESGLTES